MWYVVDQVRNPVFCFGESQALKNLWKWKAAQRWTYKRLGFPMPFLAVGFKVAQVATVAK